MKINEVIVEQRVDELGWQDIKQGAAKVGQAVTTGAQAAAKGLGATARGIGAGVGGAVGAAQGAWDASKQGFTAGQQAARTAVAGTQQPQPAGQTTVAQPPATTTKANPPKTATTTTSAGQTPNMQGQVQQRQEPTLGGGVTQAPGFKAGAAVPPGAGGQTNSLANAIRAGAAGGQVAVQKPADAYYERAPIGTTVNATNGQWKKGYEGWVNAQTNTRATAQQAKLLDQHWYKTTQKQIKAQGAQQAQPQQATTTTVTPPPPPARPRTGGKVAGQVSQTPSAVKQRQARQAKKTTAQPAAPVAQSTATKAPFKPTVVPK